MDANMEPIGLNSPVAEDTEDKAAPVQMEIPKHGLIHILKYVLMIANAIFAVGQIIVLLLFIFVFDKFKRMVIQHNEVQGETHGVNMDTAITIMLAIVVLLMLLSLVNSLIGFYAAYKGHIPLLIVYGSLEGIYAFLLLFSGKYVFFILYLALSVCAFVSVKFIKDKNGAFASLPTV